mmetsp:Transcript_312/g.872  ORF Transcript_312/g.872 Transcript_312/m.872 type:complete len:397 (-) Transcript_312:714-1904(-)
MRDRVNHRLHAVRRNGQTGGGLRDVQHHLRRQVEAICGRVAHEERHEGPRLDGVRAHMRQGYGDAREVSPRELEHADRSVLGHDGRERRDDALDPCPRDDGGAAGGDQAHHCPHEVGHGLWRIALQPIRREEHGLAEEGPWLLLRQELARRQGPRDVRDALRAQVAEPPPALRGDAQQQRVDLRGPSAAAGAPAARPASASSVEFGAGPGEHRELLGLKILQSANGLHRHKGEDRPRAEANSAADGALLPLVVRSAVAGTKLGQGPDDVRDALSGETAQLPLLAELTQATLEKVPDELALQPQPRNGPQRVGEALRRQLLHPLRADADEGLRQPGDAGGVGVATNVPDPRETPQHVRQVLGCEFGEGSGRDAADVRDGGIHVGRAHIQLPQGPGQT